MKLSKNIQCESVSRSNVGVQLVSDGQSGTSAYLAEDSWSLETLEAIVNRLKHMDKIRIEAEKQMEE